MIIGISGNAESGKTTATNYMLRRLGYTYSTDSFAQPIKNMLAAVDVDCADSNKQVIHPIFALTPRQLMQKLGTDWGREIINERIWIKLLHARNPNQTNLIISDVRMDNEADYVRERGGIILIIDNGKTTKDTHISESGLTPHPDDHTIVNDSTLKSLYDQLDDIILAYKL